MRSDRYHVPGVSCQHCVAAVTAEVGKLIGVSRVEVDLDRKIVTVEHDAGVAEATIVAAIKAAGYEEVYPLAEG